MIKRLKKPTKQEVLKYEWEELIIKAVELLEESGRKKDLEVFEAVCGAIDEKWERDIKKSKVVK